MKNYRQYQEALLECDSTVFPVRLSMSARGIPEQQ
jgi:hypothetical protein